MDELLNKSLVAGFFDFRVESKINKIAPDIR